MNISASFTKFSECMANVGRLNKSGQKKLTIYKMQDGCISRGNENHSSLTIAGMLSSMPISGNRLKDTNPPPL
ncbi:hypothetical protein PRUPE_4G269800 [Prunus persica]|uniref:Uncharacterized protein n=1 Tax=Prunus persica TaxID=3760 RepID=A0A251PRP2_PRUPE|nr:hypothetical protein PRUPE_4G269800 [Prunus persica]